MSIEHGIYLVENCTHGDRRERARAKKKANKGSWLQRKDFFFKQKKKRHETILKGMSSEMQARPGGGKICVIFLKSRFTSMLVLILILVLLSHPFQITARVAREDQTSRGVLFIFYHPPIHWGGKGKGGVRGSHTGRLGGRKGEEKQNNLLFPPPLSGWICRSLTNYKHTRTLVCNRCTCNCSSCCTWTVERGSRRWEQLWGKQKSWRALRSGMLLRIERDLAPRAPSTKWNEFLRPSLPCATIFAGFLHSLFSGGAVTLRWHLIISSGAEGQKAPDSSDAQIERETSDSETREAAVPFSFPLCSAALTRHLKHVSDSHIRIEVQ